VDQVAVDLGDGLIPPPVGYPLLDRLEPFTLGLWLEAEEPRRVLPPPGLPPGVLLDEVEGRAAELVGAEDGSLLGGVGQARVPALVDLVP
jgi:hypothetical protein